MYDSIVLFFWFNRHLDAIKRLPTKYRYILICNTGCYYDNDRIRTVFRAAYLGTINNLSSPITKNASQTMKVTYTLTDKEDSDETI